MDGFVHWVSQKTLDIDHAYQRCRYWYGTPEVKIACQIGENDKSLEKGSLFTVEIVLHNNAILISLTIFFFAKLLPEVSHGSNSILDKLAKLFGVFGFAVFGVLGLTMFL